MEAHPNFLQADTSLGVYASLINTPNSIGYVVYSTIATQGQINNIHLVSVENKNGIYTLPDNTFVQYAQNQVTFTAPIGQNQYLSLVDLPGDTSWPIVGFSYIYFNSVLESNCSLYSEMFKWFRWILTDPTAASRAVAYGYSPLSSKHSPRFISLLEQQTCQQNYLLTIQYVPQHQSNGYIVVLAADFLFFILAIVGHVYLTCKISLFVFFFLDLF